MAKLYFRYGSMSAGKSIALLQVAHNYETNGAKVQLFTAAIDDRYSVGKITSRIGLSREADTYAADTDFSKSVGDVACVIVDEAQFLTEEQVVQLHKVARTRDIPVLCYGLRTDFRGKPFPGSVFLLALAETIEEIKTVCECGMKATMNVRLDQDGLRVREGEQVQIGGNDRYKPLCATCFYA